MFKIFKKKEKPQPKIIMHPELGKLKFSGDELPYAYDTEYGVTLFLLPEFVIEGTEYSIDYLNGSDDRDDFFDQ